MILESLEKLGFSPKEAAVYVMLLRMGPLPASTLAKRVGYKRVTVYSVLEALELRGLVSSQESQHARRFCAHAPNCLLDTLEEKALELRALKRVTSECVQALEDLRGATIVEPSFSF